MPEASSTVSYHQLQEAVSAWLVVVEKKLIDTDLTLEADLESLFDPESDPLAAIQWTTNSLANLTTALADQQHTVKKSALADVLAAKGFLVKANMKNIEGVSNPDRNGQFQLINATVEDFQETGDPIISVDTKNRFSLR